MKTQKLLLAFMALFSVGVYSQSVMVLNFEGNGTDKNCTNRYTANRPTSPTLSIVDNPIKNGIDNSNKALRLSGPQEKGMFGVGLRGYWETTSQVFIHYTNPSDTIKMYDLTSKKPVYDRLRFKYYITGNTQSSLPVYVEFYDYSPLDANKQPTQLHSASNPGVWTYTFEGANEWSDWNEITVDISGINNTVGRILFYTFNKWTPTTSELSGIKIYIDDIELYNSTSSGVSDIKDNSINCSVIGRNLKISDIKENSKVNITDICGKSIYKTNVSGNIMDYTFSKEGVYLILITESNRTSSKKIIIK